MWRLLHGTGNVQNLTSVFNCHPKPHPLHPNPKEAETLANGATFAEKLGTWTQHLHYKGPEDDEGARKGERVAQSILGRTCLLSPPSKENGRLTRHFVSSSQA